MNLQIEIFLKSGVYCTTLRPFSLSRSKNLFIEIYISLHLFGVWRQICLILLGDRRRSAVSVVCTWCSIFVLRIHQCTMSVFSNFLSIYRFLILKREKCTNLDLIFIYNFCQNNKGFCLLNFILTGQKIHQNLQCVL